MRNRNRRLDEKTGMYEFSKHIDEVVTVRKIRFGGFLNRLIVSACKMKKLEMIDHFDATGVSVRIFLQADDLTLSMDLKGIFRLQHLLHARR